jgi:RNA 3'-terminal phosphate cyclase
MGSGAVIYIPRFIKVGSAKFDMGDTSDRINLLLFFKNKESALKMLG